MTADKGTTDLRAALIEHEPRADYGYESMLCSCGWKDADAIGLRQVDPDAKTWPEHILGVYDRAALAPTESAKGTTDLRAALDVPTVERVLRRYFQAVDATGRSRSWWRVRAEEVAAALASTESDPDQADPDRADPDRADLQSAYTIALRQIEHDGEVIKRLEQALQVAHHSPHNQDGEPNEGFPTCSVCGAIQTQQESES